MSWRDEDDIERAARAMRIALGIDDQLRPDMITVVIKLKHLGYINDYVRVPDAEMPDDEAFFDPSTKLLHLRETIFRAANATQRYSDAERQRARFTIAHEIGHITAGHLNIRYRGKTTSVAQTLVAKIRNEEYEANRFAAAFLVPAYLAGK